MLSIRKKKARRIDAPGLLFVVLGAG